MKSNTKKKKGIPSEYALFLDEDLRLKLSAKESLFLEEYLEVLFPKKYQERYNEIALKLLNELKKNNEMRSNKELKEFIEREKIFRETLYSKIIDKMDRFGVIEKNYIKNDKKINDKKIRGKPFYIKISPRCVDLFKNLSDRWYMIYATLKDSAKIEK